MSRTRSRLSLKRAVGLSTGLHLLLAPLFVTSATLALGSAGATGAAGSGEATQVSYLSIVHRGAPHRSEERQIARAQPAHTVTAERPSPKRAPAARTRKAAPTADDASHVAAASPAGARRASSPARIAIALATAAPERDSEPAQQPAPASTPLRDDVASPNPSPAPMPSPSPSAAASKGTALVVEAVVHGGDVPAGGWGQSFEKPLVADDAALADLRARYHAAAVSIEVDEAGHATRVVLPNNLPGDERAELERRLRDLRYVPAECNGLHCAGTLLLSI